MRAAGLAFGACLVLIARASFACPCRGTVGPGGALTTASETLGVSVTESATTTHGAWSALGRYSPLADDTTRTDLALVLAAAWRASRRVELAVSQGWGVQRLSTSAFHDERTGFGDLSWRVRWEALDEPMPWTGSPWPSFAAIASVRAPTGDTGGAGATSLGRIQSGTTGSAGASPTSQTLGTWEAALAAELQRSVTSRWTTALVLEGALRLPDESLGLKRQLGPRVLAQISLAHAPSTWVSLGALADLAWEGDVSLDDETRSGTTQRLLTFGLTASHRVPDTGWRSGFAVRHAPAIDEVNVNATRATSLAVSLGWGR